MPDITVYENEDAYIDRTLKYGRNWSVVAKRGAYIPQTDTTTIYFYVSANQASSPYISLTTASSSQIAWTDAVNGKIRIYLGSNTSGHVGDDQYYEIRIKFADGSYVTAESGNFNVITSIVDRP